MEPRIATHYRRTAKLLDGHVVEAVEPCPPGMDNVRTPLAHLMLAAGIAVLLIGAASAAGAAPLRTGSDAAGNALACGGGITDPHHTIATGLSAVTAYKRLLGRRRELALDLAQ